MRFGRRYLLFGLAFTVWGICFYGALAIAGARWSFCRGDEHVAPACNPDSLWLIPLAVLFIGGWLVKRLATRLRIDW